MADWSELPPELLDDIHGRLRLLSRQAFAAVCASWRHVHRAASGPRIPEAPWLMLPGSGRRAATLFSLSDGRAVTVHVPRPPMRSGVVVGSSGCGWLVTADYWESRLHLLNPLTGAQAELPALTTMQCLDDAPGNKFVFDTEDYTLIRFEDSARWRPSPPVTYSRSFLRQDFLRKVVVSPSTRPGSYEAMLLQCLASGPAFTTASHGEWSLAPSPHGAEDAIYYRGRFYSVASSGVVEAWDRLDLGDGEGMYRSTVVTSKLAKEDDWVMNKYPRLQRSSLP